MRKYIFIIVIILSAAILCNNQNIYGSERLDHNCIKCHQITNDEVMNLLSEPLPGVKILEIRIAPVKGLWEVTIERNGQKGIAYIDFSKKLLMSGAIFDIKKKENLTQARLIEINKIDVSQIPLDDALLMGDKDAKHRVIVFTDPD